MHSNNNDLTSASGSPSLFWQRVMLMVFLTAIGAVAWWLNAASKPDYAAQKISAPPLTEVVADLNFTNAESSWSGLQFDAQGNLIIDSHTEPALSDAIILVQHQGSKQATERMVLLLEKQFGTAASQKIMALFDLLKQYKDFEQRWWAENSNRMPPPHDELFQLQDELLGEALAEKLFSEQRRLANMMLASYRINNDSNLSQEEKDRALAELQADFQNNFEQSKLDEPDS